MKKSLVAVATVAALGAATIPVAQAHDGAAPIIAGAVIGAVIGTAIAHSQSGPAPVVVHRAPPPRVVYAPPPRVVYAPPPRVVYVRPAPRAAYLARRDDRRDWRDHDRHDHDRWDRH